MQPAQLSSASPIAHLFQKNAPIILAFYRKRGVQAEDAEDLLLEVFTAAIENPRLITLPENEQLAWLKRVAHNKLVDHYRRQSYRQTTPLEASYHQLFESDEEAPEFTALRQESHEELRHHISQLPTEHQEILRLRFTYDMPSKEIARLLSKSDTAVRGLLWRAVTLLRTTYGEKQGRGK
ncbi:RNA polymerase sigma factor [Dictyobacter halimunensis]